ncbi:MAG: hypothetical protein Q8918_10310 [Bacteroidota bacterium]|nr:hypothetical protein [Bacteroidota bacterium]MDP4211705.1 hypothetical protein [Bacteroidota bacterium]MDP4250488.1 hypothetical protein [Bacteroidota bacterium]
MKKLTSSERKWVIIFIVIIIALMTGCLIGTVSSSKTWNPRPVEIDNGN